MSASPPAPVDQQFFAEFKAIAQKLADQNPKLVIAHDDSGVFLLRRAEVVMLFSKGMGKIVDLGTTPHNVTSYVRPARLTKVPPAQGRDENEIANQIRKEFPGRDAQVGSLLHHDFGQIWKDVELGRISGPEAADLCDLIGHYRSGILSQSYHEIARELKASVSEAPDLPAGRKGTTDKRTNRKP